MRWLIVSNRHSTTRKSVVRIRSKLIFGDLPTADESFLIGVSEKLRKMALRNVNTSVYYLNRRANLIKSPKLKDITAPVPQYHLLVELKKAKNVGELTKSRFSPKIRDRKWVPISDQKSNIEMKIGLWAKILFLEKFKTWPLPTRIYYNYMKRPAVAIGTPFYNWGRDYYAVGEDHVSDFKKQPIRSKLSFTLILSSATFFSVHFVDNICWRCCCVGN